MAILDDIGRKLTQTADVAKINSKISFEEKNLNALYIQLGQQFYTGAAPYLGGTEGGVPPAVFEQLTPLCFRISGTVTEINKLKDSLIVAKNIRRCTNCGAECPNTVPFCATCGAQLPVAEPIRLQPEAYAPPPAAAAPLPTEFAAPPEAAPYFCVNCGKQLAAGAAFCTDCGARQE
ncbi:MAG: zinc-ribbon domain-containing protein [Oscillospiraceae bacterium]|jgi:hypothetical protein|nr:zinc-ribbon domain-containing protein [Oscillospiraceae bacterium]